jgi:hypothetical protein
VFLSDFQDAAVAWLRRSVQNGEITERGLARMTGISQPHVHNVLNGKRRASPELIDHVFRELRLSVLDVVDADRLRRHIEERAGVRASSLHVPVLRGKIGPGHKWPTAADRHGSFSFPLDLIGKMWQPVAVRLADDARMRPLFGEGDVALLDQSYEARTVFDADAYYAIKRGNSGLIRRIRASGRTIYAVADDSLNTPSRWESLPLGEHQVTHFVRARVTLVGTDMAWAPRSPA